MQLNTILFAIATVFSAAEACKCGGNIDATRACCRNVGGVPTSNDCPANTINERLSNFHNCCLSLGTSSDCRCPIGCLMKEVEAERRVQGLPVFSDSEKLDFLMKYEGKVN